MWPYHPELLKTPVPRYTSFPTAAEFGPAIGAPAQEEALRRVTGEVSLYVHIPFCEKVCWYCGCNTSATNRPDRVSSYLDALYLEIEMVARLLPKTGVRISAISFGGGSPNALTPVDFTRLVQALTVGFDAFAPTFSAEFDPRTLDPAWSDVLRAVGVTRASLGVQTFSPALQEAIGRIQPDEQIVSAVAILREGGVRSLNFDLMYGLPGQTLEDVEASLARSLELEADRIALFGYAHVPHLIARQRKIDAANLPGQADRFEMAKFGYRLLTDEGYVPVGFDHFAKPGDPLAQAALSGRLHRNFQGFTEDSAATVIGLGSSAISSFPDLLVQNEKNAGRYRMQLSHKRLAGCVGVRRSEADQTASAFIEQLLCSGTAYLGECPDADVVERLEAFRRLRLIDCADGSLHITNDGLPYARTIAALFDPYRRDAVRRFSSAI